MTRGFRITVSKGHEPSGTYTVKDWEALKAEIERLDREFIRWWVTRD